MRTPALSREMYSEPAISSIVRCRPAGGAREGKRGVPQGERNRRFRSPWALDRKPERRSNQDEAVPSRDPVGLFALSIPSGMSACLSPRFYPHSVGPTGPLLDGVPRFGGALLSLRRSQWTKTRNAVCPIATVMLYFNASRRSFSASCDLLAREPIVMSPSVENQQLCGFSPSLLRIAAIACSDSWSGWLLVASSMTLM